MKLSTLSLKELRRRPGRSLLTLLGITVGVATVVAVPTSLENTRAAFGSMFADATGDAALEVVAEGLGGFDPRIAERIANAEGVVEARPVVQSAAALVGDRGPVPILVLGHDRLETAVVLVRGQLPTLSRPGIVVPENLAAQNFGGRGAAVGSTVNLWTTSGFESVPLLGILESRGAANANGGAVAFTTLAEAQRLFALEERVNSVHLRVRDPLDSDGLRSRLTRELPTGYSVRTPATRGALAQTSFEGVRQSLGALSAVSLVAAAFIILNTFLMNVGERRRQLAIFRALGMRPRALSALLVRESLVVGLVGSAVGVPLGIALSFGLAQSLNEGFGSGSSGFELRLSPIITGLVLGPSLSVLATFVPARRAARETILAGIFERRSRGARRLEPTTLAVATGLLMFPLFTEVGMLLEWFDRAWLPRILGPALAVGLVGFVLLIPLVAPALLKLVSLVIRRLLGSVNRLALRQLDGNPARTDLTVSVLFIALAVAVAMGTSLVGGIEHIRSNIAAIARDDFFVRGAWPTTSLVLPTPMPESLGNELGELDGIRRVDKVTWVPARSGDRFLTLIATSLDRDSPPPIEIVEGDPEQIAEGFSAGGVVVGTTLARNQGLDLSSRLSLETRDGPRDIPVVGIVAEYTSAGFAAYIDWDTAKRLLQFSGVHVFRVSARSGQAEAASSSLREFCEARGLLFQTSGDFKAVVDKLVDEITGLLWGLIILSFVVASLGVVNTISMNTLEQTRELGLLRAVGMKRRQVLTLVLTQAGALALTSIVPGAAIGILLSYAMNLANEVVNGIDLPFRIQPWFLLGCFALTIGISLLAAFIPARRAARIPVTTAIHYE